MLNIYNDGNRITAAICCDIDHHAARELRMLLENLISVSRPETLIIDLEKVTFMDSSGIGLLMGRLRSLREYGGTLIIKNANSHIATVIKMSGLTENLIEGVNV